jgi:tRNA (guanine37-N1)-methyltransferase
LNIDVLTLFPQFFHSPLECALLGKALEKDLLKIETHNFREFSEFKHSSVDDTPYGGGSGMILRPEPLENCIQSVFEKYPEKPFVIYPSPSGVKLTQNLVEDLSKKESITFICGRYEGIDQRFLEQYVDLEVSIGDYVLAGGEVATLTMIEAISRFIPGVLGNPESLKEESFQENLLEHPQYTKPAVWNNKEVPEVLLSGHHEKIDSWRKELSKKRTSERRPDLIK